MGPKYFFKIMISNVSSAFIYFFDKIHVSGLYRTGKMIYLLRLNLDNLNRRIIFIRP
jgi:hypothetical protein